MDNANITLSVVMPAYNEEAGIEAAVREVEEHVLDLVAGSELIVVNDGSRDNTGRILDSLAGKDPRIRVIHQENSGHGPALRTGLDAARGEYIFLVDSDRQIPMHAFAAFWRERARDGVFGVRVKRHDPRLRLILTSLIRKVLRAWLGVKLYDANVPFKLIRREAWLQAAPFIPPDTLAPSLFLAVFMKRRGMDVAQREVPHAERKTGVVSIRRWKLLKFCYRAFIQLFRFKRRLGAAGTS